MAEVDISKIALPDGTVCNLKASGGGGTSNFYGTCTTAADQQIKAVTISQDQNFELKKGVIIAVLFSNSNTYDSTVANPVKLNVNNTGNKEIKYAHYDAGEYTGVNVIVYGYANRVIYYMYDGSYWLWLNHGADANTTYSSMSASEADTGTSTTGRLISAKVLNDLIASKAGAVKNLTVTCTSNSNFQVTTGFYTPELKAVQSGAIVLISGSVAFRCLQNSYTIPANTTLITISGVDLQTNKTQNMYVARSEWGSAGSDYTYVYDISNSSIKIQTSAAATWRWNQGNWPLTTYAWLYYA